MLIASISAEVVRGGVFFFFNDPATTEIYTLSLHDALPISVQHRRWPVLQAPGRHEHRGILPLRSQRPLVARRHVHGRHRSEEHTSELQSQSNLVCRLLLEKKKHITITATPARSVTLDSAPA